MRKTAPFVILPLLAATAAAQIPSPVSVLRDVPRASWAIVSSVPASTIPQRADAPGAATNDKLYLFGGCSGNNTSTTLNDLWVFDGTNATQLAPTGTLPPARGRHAFAYDPLADKLILFGGDTRGTTNTMLNDVWQYDPVANSWTDVTPSGGPAPSGRRWPGMAFDPVTTAMLVFGGNDPTNGDNNNDTWLFLAGAWIPMSPATVPPARSMAQLCTRPDFNDVIMVGGRTDAAGGYYRHGAWSWNGGDWVLLQDGTPGTATSWKAQGVGNSAVYDPLRKRVIIQGGNGIGAYSGGSSSPYWTALGNEYGGSPSQYTSEFDCLTNEWTIYANPQVDNTTTTTFECNRNDPVLGRVSRYATGFVPALGKVYMMGGQNVAQSGSYQRYVLEYQADPIASSTVNGAGCTGSAGPMALAADNDPWSGRAWNLTGSGFPASSLGAAFIGFGTQSLPISAIHPAGGAGCQVLVTQDAQLLLLPSGGQASLSLSLPNTPVISGITLNTQMYCVELSGNQITLITSTNAVAGLIGAL